MTTRIRPVQHIEVMDRQPLVVDPPATASSPGTPGTIAWDASYLYLCVATDTWVRTALESW